MQRLAVTAAAAVSVGAVVCVDSAHAALIYGVTPDNTLFSFDSATPGTINNGFPISGFTAAGENIRGIDFRPATGQLYALGSFGQLYTVNLATAALTPVGAATPINGTAFGFDFNPTIDRIRVVSNTNKNYVYHPVTGVQTAATDLFYGLGDPNVGVDPNVVGSAYTNSVLGTVPASSQLYGIDSGIDILATQANSAGTLGTVGPLLTVNTSALVGFDIFSPAEGNNTAFASLTPTGGSVSNLYTINLATGAAILVGQIDGGIFVNDIAVQPVPEPAAVGVLGLAAFALLGRRRES
jgi:MYXO-CTERM domain-containing protein